MWWPAVLALSTAHGHLQDCENSTCSANFVQVQSQARIARQPWPHARGPYPLQYGFTTERFTGYKLSWTYHDPKGKYHNILAGGPVIDQDRNLFQMTAKGVLAFNSNGQQLWSYIPPGVSNNEVSLAGDLLLGSTKTGYAFALNRKSGKEVWTKKLAIDAGGDCGYPAAAEGVFVVGAVHGKAHDGGNEKIFGLDVKDGKGLWEYTPDLAVWNLMPLFPADGTVLFMDYAGGMYRLNLKTGQEIWKSLPMGSRASFSDGGATMGPNGLVYTCSNFGENQGVEGTTGIVRAFFISNGTQAWYKLTMSPCNSYPAVGHLIGVNPLALAVVVTPGSFMGQRHLHGEILALNAETGDQIWRHVVKPYDDPDGMAAGDTEGIPTRTLEGIQAFCLPAHWSAAMIDGGGTVLAGRSDGNLYQVHGPESTFKGPRNSNMVVDNGTIAEVIHFGSAFLHGAMAAAPGLFAISSCDTIHVFKN